LHLDNLQFFTHLFIKKMPFFWANAGSTISQPTDRCSPRQHCCRLALFKIERGGSKNGDKTLRPWIFYSSFTHFFLIKLPFLGRIRHQWNRSPQTDVCPIATAFRLSLLKQRGEAKRIVKKHHTLTILPFFCPPFFNKIAICGINVWSRHCSTQANFCPITTATRLSLLTQSGEGKRNVRNSQEFSIFQFFNSPFFN
jgi:hypothetical protein